MIAEREHMPGEDGTGLRVQGISKRVRGRQVLDNVSLTLFPGEIVALVGPNGSGKSTLYNILAELEYPDSGQISLDGRDITRLPGFGRARLGLCYLPQEPSVLRGLSVRENLEFVLETHATDPLLKSRRIDALLDRYSLCELGDSRPANLSGGQQRRCEMARALVGDPRFLLLDEPFAKLDPISIEVVSAQVQDLAAQGIGVLITDHNIRAILSIANRVFVLLNGVVIGNGSPRCVMANAELRSAILPSDFVL